MILLSKLSATLDPEYGETLDHAYIFEDEPHTFRELIQELRNYTEASASDPENTYWVFSWDLDYETGEIEETSLHYSRNQNPRARKYWEKALKYCKLI